MIRDFPLPDEGIEFPGGYPVAALDTAADLEVAVDAPDGTASRPLVEVVDVLGNHGYPVGLLEAGDGQVSRIGPGFLHDRQELLGEAVEGSGVGQEGVNLKDVEIGGITVKAAGGAEVGDAALGGDPRPGQEDDPFRPADPIIQDSYLFHKAENMARGIEFH